MYRGGYEPCRAQKPLGSISIWIENDLVWVRWTKNKSGLSLTWIKNDLVQFSLSSAQINGLNSWLDSVWIHGSSSCFIDKIMSFYPNSRQLIMSHKFKLNRATNLNQ